MSFIKETKVVILAGGKGVRLYPITQEIPKPLLPVKKKPILNYLIDLFYSYGVEEIAISINKNFREDFDWWQKRYYSQNNLKFIEEKEPLGTFGGLYYLKNWLGEKPFFFTNGDELKQINLAKMKKFHEKKKGLGTIALVKVPDPQNYGVAMCKNGLIERFVEKPKDPPSQYVSSGLYLLSPEILKYHHGPKFSMIEKDLFPILAEQKKLGGFKFKGKWMDCGTWERYERALKEWR